MPCSRSTRRNENKEWGTILFFSFFLFFLTRHQQESDKRWKFGPRLSSWKTRRKKERHSTTEVRRRTWIENEGTPRFFAIFFVLLARMRWKSTSRTGRYRRLERVRFASVDTNGRFSLFSRVIFFWPLHEKRLNVHRKCPGIGRMRKHASRFRAINVTFECVYVCWDAHVCWLLCLCVSESGAFEMHFWTQKWEKKREFSFTAFTRLICGSYTHLHFFLFLN